MKKDEPAPASLLAAVQQVLDAPALPPGELLSLVEQVLNQRSTYLRAARDFGTPQYLVEEIRL